MERGEIYCEIGFINKFWETSPDHSSCEEEDRKKSKSWINFRDLILTSFVHFDVSEKELIKYTENKIVFTLLKRYNNGEDIITFDEAKFVNDNDLNEIYQTDKIYCEATFLLDQPREKYKRIMNSYGLLAFDNDSIYRSQKYFELYPKAVEKGQHHITFWKFLNELKHPCNSLTIIDNYLLQNDLDIDKNIIPIIQYLAPEKLKIPFHISIFSFDNPNKKLVDFEGRYNTILKQLNKIRPNLEIKLGIFLKNKDEHDRYVFTNYIAIDSGAGFDITTAADKTKHGTAIKITFPKTSLFIAENSDDIFLKVKKIEKEIFSHALSNNTHKNYWGEKVNRLFEI